MTLLLAIPVGLTIGLLLGALGGGGSILAVPALVYLLGQSTQAATTAALIVVGLSAMTGMFAHRHGGRVRVGQGVVFGLLGVAGSYVGSRASAGVEPNLLMAGFAVLMVLAAVGMLRNRRNQASTPVVAGPATQVVAGPATHSPAADAPRRRLSTSQMVKVVLTASAVGLITGFFGVGGGFVVVPALILALGFDAPTAIGTSLLVITINASSALAVRLSTSPDLDWPLLAVFTAAAMFSSLVGGRITARVRPRALSTAFAGLCLFLAAVIAVTTIPHLLLA